MQSKINLALFTLIVLILASGCYPVHYDGPYKGKVVDAGTGAPIEGAVVLGVWYKEIPTAAGGVSSYYDAEETVTDRNGEFEIKGKGLRILTNITPMNVLIFKAGYEYIGPAMWESLKLDGGLMKKKVAWEGDRAIIPLKKLTMKERKRRLFGKENIPDDKQELLIKELNKERIEIGLRPYGKEK
ncbi:MAG: hypothetical protein P8013_15025 [Candidatus Sulfobium sp.]